MGSNQFESTAGWQDTLAIAKTALIVDINTTGFSIAGGTTPAQGAPVGFLGIGDTVGYKYTTAQSLAYGYATTVSSLFGAIPPTATLETSTYGYGSTAAMLDSIRVIGKLLADRASTNVDTTINALMAPFITQLNAERDLEVAQMNLNFNAMNGFFNSNVNNRVIDVQTRYAKLKAAKLAEFNFEFRKYIDTAALSSIQIMAAYRNAPLDEKMQLERFRAMLLVDLANCTVNNIVSSTNILSEGAKYGYNESKRVFQNDTAAFWLPAEGIRWQGEMLQLLANVAGAGQQSKPKSAMVVESAVSGAQMGGGIGSMVGGAIGSLVGPGPGTVAGGAIGTIAGGLLGGLISGVGAALSH